MKKGPQAKECGPPLENEKYKESNSLHCFQKSHDLANTLILVQ